MAWQISFDASVGAVPFVSTDYVGTTVQTTAGTFREGTRSFRVQKGSIANPGWFRCRFVTPPSTPAISSWIYLLSSYFDREAANRWFEVRLVTTSGHSVSARWDRSRYAFDLYVGESLVAYGDEDVITDVGLFNLRLYGVIDGTTGTLGLNVNGVEVATFSGNTLPGGSDTEIDYLEFYGRGDSGATENIFYVSCISLNDDGADPGDRRVFVRMVDSDVSTQWTPSTGSTNWPILDDIPPSTTYVEASTDALVDRLGLADIANVSSIAGVAKFIYALKTTGDTQSVLNGVESNSVVATTNNAVGTTLAYHYHLMTVDPDTLLAFTISDVNALLAYKKSVIP